MHALCGSERNSNARQCLEPLYKNTGSYRSSRTKNITMDHQPSGLKFGAIGHQDSWNKVQQFVNTIRELKSADDLSLEQIKGIYEFIPPRRLFDVTMQSTKSFSCKGVYIETFIAPDQLDAMHL